jgi:hypothetical protein
MAVKSPGEIAKGVITAMQSENKDVQWGIEQMTALWQDAFPTIIYKDDADALSKVQRRQAKRQVKKTAIDTLRADISFADAYGEDIIDESAYLGTQIDTDAIDTDVVEYEIPAHKADGLRRQELAKTGFKEHGGVVFTFLNPILESVQAKMNIGSHIMFQGQRLRIAEVAQVVSWKAYGKCLYTVVNAMAA